jgi:tetratricopeptide (TPR) repeat protein
VLSFDCFDNIWEWPLSVLGVRAALLLDDFAPLRARRTWDEAQEFRYFQALAKAVERAQLVFVDTQNSSVVLQRLFPDGEPKIRRLPFGHGDGMNVGKIAAAFKTTPSNCTRTILVTAATECAGSRNLLRAIPKLAKILAPTRLTIAIVVGGLGNLEGDALVRRARCHATVVVTKEDDLSVRRFWYRRADIVVVPSELGNASLVREAIGSSIPLIVSDCSIHREFSKYVQDFMDPYGEDQIVSTLSVALQTGDKVVLRSRVDWSSAAAAIIAASLFDVELEKQDLSAGTTKLAPFHAVSQVDGSIRNSLFDDIITHGGLARCISFHEMLADNSSVSRAEMQKNWLSRYASFFDRSIGTLTIASDPDSLTAYYPRSDDDHRTDDTSYAIYQANNQAAPSLARMVFLKNFDSLAALICGSRRVVVCDDRAGDLRRIVANIASSLSKPVLVNAEVSQSMGSTSDTAVTCPPEWSRVAIALRLIAIGVSAKAAAEFVCDVDLSSSAIASWAAWGIDRSFYSSHWTQLTKWQAKIGRQTKFDAAQDCLASGKGRTLGRVYRELRARGLQRSADTARDIGNWSLAERQYRRLVEIFPAWAAIRVQLGHMLKEQGNAQSALEQYTIALAADPHSADAFFQQGQAWKLLGERAASTSAFLCVMERDRSHRGARRELQLLGWSEVEIADELRRRRGLDTASPSIVPELIQLLSFDV